MGTKITWIGEPGLEHYQGADGVQIGEGETVEVSDEKAAQMQRDFGWLVEVDGKKAAKKPEPVAPVEEDDEHVPEGDAGDGDSDSAAGTPEGDDADGEDGEDGEGADGEDGEDGEPPAADPGDELAEKRAAKKPSAKAPRSRKKSK